MSRPSKEEAEEAVWPENSVFYRAELISSLFLQASYGSGIVHIASKTTRTKKQSFVRRQATKYHCSLAALTIRHGARQ